MNEQIRCPQCNARIFDMQKGKAEVRKSSEWDGQGAIVIERLCRCKVLTYIVFRTS